MADDQAILFGDERQGQRTGFPKRVHDGAFGPTAVLHAEESGVGQ